jgi:hypothetical protein
MFSYERLSRKPLLFKSFTGLTVQEFDEIYDKEITKRYGKHEMLRLSKRKEDIERGTGAGRPFKLDIKNICLGLRTNVVEYRTSSSYRISLSEQSLTII